MPRLEVIDHLVNWRFLLAMVTPEHPRALRNVQGSVRLFPYLAVFRRRMLLPILEVVEIKNKRPEAIGALEESSLPRS